jgi:RNA ligase (TIGR02306 family)
MSTFSCPVVRVAEVTNHPNADRLSIVRLEGLGYTCISGKLEDGSPRYKAGDFVVYIPSASVLPEWLLKEMDFWNDETGKGTLAGSDGNRVKPLKLRGIFSEGVLYPVQFAPDAAGFGGVQVCYEYSTGVGEYQEVNVGDDASEFLGITKWEPPIPTHMAGEVASLGDVTVRYDFDRWESVPDIFDAGEHVVATEKLHGTCTAIRFIPSLNHPEMFGSRGEIIIYSKGLGAQGLAFKNVPENVNNLYVRQLNRLLDAGFESKLRQMSSLNGGATVTVMGETFGASVQDLGYGLKEPEFRVFDIALDNGWIDPVSMPGRAAILGLTPVPVLYDGAFDVAAIEQVRDGTSTLGGSHVREGVVVRAVNTIYHPVHGRRIAKFISPSYLLRKVKNGEPSEFT